MSAQTTTNTYALPTEVEKRTMLPYETVHCVNAHRTSKEVDTNRDIVLCLMTKEGSNYSGRVVAVIHSKFGRVHTTNLVRLDEGKFVLTRTAAGDLRAKDHQNFLDQTKECGVYYQTYENWGGEACTTIYRPLTSWEARGIIKGQERTEAMGRRMRREQAEDLKEEIAELKESNQSLRELNDAYCSKIERLKTSYKGFMEAFLDI